MGSALSDDAYVMTTSNTLTFVQNNSLKFVEAALLQGIRRHKRGKIQSRLIGKRWTIQTLTSVGSSTVKLTDENGRKLQKGILSGSGRTLCTMLAMTCRSPADSRAAMHSCKFFLPVTDRRISPKTSSDFVVINRSSSSV